MRPQLVPPLLVPPSPSTSCVSQRARRFVGFASRKRSSQRCPMQRRKGRDRRDLDANMGMGKMSIRFYREKRAIDDCNNTSRQPHHIRRMHISNEKMTIDSLSMIFRFWTPSCQHRTAKPNVPKPRTLVKSVIVIV